MTSLIPEQYIHPFISSNGITVSNCTVNIIPENGDSNFSWHPEYGVTCELESGTHYKISLLYRSKSKDKIIKASTDIKIDGKELNIIPDTTKCIQIYTSSKIKNIHININI